MKQLVCEMCGSTDLIKQDGVFVCQSCSTKYSVEEAKKLMVEGTVKIDNSERINNLLKLARTAKDEDDSTNAAKYYSLILEEMPDSWEAKFYSTYYEAMECKVIEAYSMCIKLEKLAQPILTAIKETEPEDNYAKCVGEVSDKIYAIASMFENSNAEKAAKKVPDLLMLWGNKLEENFPDNTDITEQATRFWVKTVGLIIEEFGTGEKDTDDLIAKYIAKIQKYNSEYTPPKSKLTYHTSDSPNMLYVKTVKVGHTTYEWNDAHFDTEEVFVYGPDEVGHIGVELELKNIQGKIIKYASVYVTPFNSVGDEVYCTVGNHSTYGINFTGPIAVGEEMSGYADGIWYNNTIVSARIDHVDVTYTDGTIERYKASEISKSPSLPLSQTNLNPNSQSSSSTPSSPLPPQQTNSNQSSGGCYVATAVYGSYDCPQVWTLRRFRDYTLAETWYGRLFIMLYYAISPTIVKWFGNTTWFKKMWKGKLDRMVTNLQENGFESTPYEDKHW